MEAGTSVVRFGIRCDVATSGVTCTGRDGYGFTLNPTTFEQFGPGGSEVPEP